MSRNTQFSERHMRMIVMKLDGMAFGKLIISTFRMWQLSTRGRQALNFMNPQKAGARLLNDAESCTIHLPPMTVSILLRT